jgi:DNA-binding response OmpR family regulator
MLDKMIMVVGDDDLYLKAVKLHLSKSFRHVTVVPTGEGALKASQHAIYDIVILDIHLPGLNGWAVLDKLKAYAPDTKVIIATSDDRERCRAINSGAFDLLEKPFSLNQLDDLIAHALHI